MGFAEELVDQVGAAWSVAAITPAERAAYLRAFEDAGPEAAQHIVRTFILGTRPTRPTPDEIASAASTGRHESAGEHGAEETAISPALTRAAYYRGGDPDHAPIRRQGRLTLSEGAEFVVDGPPAPAGGRLARTKASVPVTAIAYPEVLSIVDTQVAGLRGALAEFGDDPGFAAAARALDACVSRHDGLDADELCTAVIARAGGQYRVALFAWELETNRKRLEAFSSARAAWTDNCERRLARPTGDDRAETVGRLFREVVARRRTGIDYGAMSPLFAEADYLGGDPLHGTPATAGILVARDAGLAFRLADGSEELHLRPRELRSAALRRPDVLRHAAQAGQAAAVAELVGGEQGVLWGALVGRRWKSRHAALLVVAERGGVRFTAGFALAEIPGRRLVDQLQVQRLQLGMPALPAPEDRVQSAPIVPETGHAAAGRPSPPADANSPAAAFPPEVVQTPDPLDQIERLGSLRDRGLITDDEFVAKKRDLLDRL